MSPTESVLPIEFLTVIATVAEPGSIQAEVAASHALSSEDGRMHATLLPPLLAGPYSKSAPKWMLDAAAAEGLKLHIDWYVGPQIELAVLALTHPDCPPNLIRQSLTRCTEIQLGNLGSAGRPKPLVLAVITELRRRSPRPRPLDRCTSGTTSPAVLILRSEKLDDTLFEAAVALLPAAPEDLQARDAADSWQSMWTAILSTFPQHHYKLVERAHGTAAEKPISYSLIGKLPWKVEPLLLKQLVQADLAGLHVALLITKICRARRDGIPLDDVRSRFSADLEVLGEFDREKVDAYLESDQTGIKLGCRAAVDWISEALAGRWRFLLHPGEANPRYRDPVEWCASDEVLDEVGQAFARTAAGALEWWEPRKHLPISESWQLTWVAEIVTRLTESTDGVKVAVHRIIADAELGRVTSAGAPGRRRSVESLRKLDGMISTLDGFVEGAALVPFATSTPILVSVLESESGPELKPEPVLNRIDRTPASERPLPDRSTISIRALTAVSDAALTAYMKSHPGDDDLVEMALLAVAWGSRLSSGSFTLLLALHSDPECALVTLSHNLRRRLGGGPSQRQAWVGNVLKQPECSLAAVRALPAWEAIRARDEGSWSRTHPDVVTTVLAALGDDVSVWRRFEESPISLGGPNAWFRLGDILDAATGGGDRPQPPPAD